MRKRYAAMLLLCIATVPVVHANELEELARMERFMSIMGQYHQLIETTYGTASNPQKAAIMQLQKIQEIYQERGERSEGIKVLTEVVNNAKDGTVRNAASIMLADALKETGNSQRALEVLKKALQENLRGM